MVELEKREHVVEAAKELINKNIDNMNIMLKRLKDFKESVNPYVEDIVNDFINTGADDIVPEISNKLQQYINKNIDYVINRVISNVHTMCNSDIEDATDAIVDMYAEDESE